MEKNGNDKITAFDTLFTTNHIQMLKILMPYFDPPMRKQLVIYIKYLELRYALSYFDSNSHELYGCAEGYGHSLDGADPFGKEEFNINKICSELLPYCTSDEKQKVEQISGLFRSMEMYKEMSQTLEVMKDFMPDFSPDSAQDSNSSGGMNQENGMTEMLMNMLSPEQKAMFEMFGGNTHESK